MQKDVKNHNYELLNIATRDVISVSPTTSIIGAVELMTKKGFRRLPVTDPGTNKIIGIVTAGDIINFMGGGEKFNLVSGKHKGNIIAALNDSVREIMSTKLLTLKESAKVIDVAATIVNKKCGGIPIVDDEGILRGIVTERDILKVFCETPNYLSVSDIMTKSPHVTSPDATICGVTREMIKKKFRRLPVVSDDVLFGIVTAMDIMKYVGNGDVFKEMVTGDVSDVMSVPIRKLINGDLYTTSPDESISRVAQEMIGKGVGALPVIENSHLIGVITEFDLVKALSIEKNQG
ncbi:CBS domain-containing protein [Methanomicrobium antiquum]|uniref:CBS domain-containing protein n=1 Tax=Methanomicrobium antiquum TaxID=487686 RepID=A0AAF0JT92_9EURY|nr:CBS domain-containing protein [Methanomicrobium antiquum]WFN36028.1 CBS domain-containing protein [Methanomicrobium antiquum]